MGLGRVVLALALLAPAVRWDLAAASTPAYRQTPGAPADGVVFAVEITTGPKWDNGRPAAEQAYFREHSANLRQLRERGALLVGARYAEKGFLVLAAPSLEAARAMLDQDPSFNAGVFGYEVHEMSVVEAMRAA